MKNKKVIIFIIILVVAAFFRLYHIKSIPPGLYPDEAMNGNNAIEALETGHFKIFYPDNNGREGLFINFQALSLKIFGYHVWSLRLVSAIIGILTVIGLYFLTKELFNWEISAIASFLLAISFWHVNFSRIGFRAIMLPFILVYGFYFLWRGIRTTHLGDYLLAGVFAGLGFYTYTSYRISPLIALTLFINYWWYLKKDFSHEKYEHAKHKLLRGFSLLLIITIIMALPISIYFFKNFGDFLKREGMPISVFAQSYPWQELGKSTIKTLGMFNFNGDYGQRHNLPGNPQLIWPIGIFFVIGFFKELIHWLRKKHGHFSTVHTFLFCWFFIMLIPGFVTIEAPHALRTIGALPVVMIFTAKGIWWFFKKLEEWYKISDPHSQLTSWHEATMTINLVLIIFLGSVGFIEFWRYFEAWAKSQGTASAFNQNYVLVGRKLNDLPRELKKYVLVNTDSVLVRGIPVPAQTVMFITDTATIEKQRAKNIFYLNQNQYSKGKYDKESVIIPLE